MNRSIVAAIWLLFFSLLFVGCTKENPNPELDDPIYQDLTTQQKDNESKYQAELTKQANLQKKVDADAPNTIDLASDRRDLTKSLHVAVKYRQMALYYKIRAERRKVEDKFSYHQAFINKKPWPDSKEYSEYLVNKRLNSTSLNWDSRVPKLHDRVVNYEKHIANREPAKEK